MQGKPGLHVSSGRMQAIAGRPAYLSASHSGGWMSKLKTSADVASSENSLLVHEASPHCILILEEGARGPITQGQESCHEAPSS